MNKHYTIDEVKSAINEVKELFTELSEIGFLSKDSLSRDNVMEILDSSQKASELSTQNKVVLYQYIEEAEKLLDWSVSNDEILLEGIQEEYGDAVNCLKNYTLDSFTTLDCFAAGFANIDFEQLYAEAQEIGNVDLINKLTMMSGSITSPTFGDECGLGKHDLAYANGYFDDAGQFIVTYCAQYNNPDRHNAFNFETKEFWEVKDSERPDWSYEYKYSFEEVGLMNRDVVEEMDKLDLIKYNELMAKDGQLSMEEGIFVDEFAKKHNLDKKSTAIDKDRDEIDIADE